MTTAGPAGPPQRDHRRAAARHRPARGLDVLAVGLDRFAPPSTRSWPRSPPAARVFKAVRGRVRRAARRSSPAGSPSGPSGAGFATSRDPDLRDRDAAAPAETVYRRVVERLDRRRRASGALRPVVDGWFYVLEEDVLADGGRRASTTPTPSTPRPTRSWSSGSPRRPRHPAFAPSLRGLPAGRGGGDGATADGLVAWLGGQPNVAASVKRAAGVKGEIDHFGALCFLQGLLTVLRDCGHPGLLLVLDEVETLQRVRVRRPRQVAQRAAPADRRDRRRALPRPVPA